VFLLAKAPVWCNEYPALSLVNSFGNAALKTGRSIGTQEFKFARAGSVTLQKAAQIIEYGRSRRVDG
jgi:hypothetical protein